VSQVGRKATLHLRLVEVCSGSSRTSAAGAPCCGSRRRVMGWTEHDFTAIRAYQDGRRYFRPETMAAIDAVIEGKETPSALLMAS
jgi:hypothetical protein